MKPHSPFLSLLILLAILLLWGLLVVYYPTLMAWVSFALAALIGVLVWVRVYIRFIEN